MSAKRVDIATMLDELNLPLAAARWSELWDAPEIVDYTPGQLFREVLEPQYLETMNNRSSILSRFCKFHRRCRSSLRRLLP